MFRRRSIRRWRATIGHLDPRFIQIMDEIKEQLRQVIGTQNDLTLPISGTGSAGMETCFVNLVEPGDRVLVLSNGVFGQRMRIPPRVGAAVEVGIPLGHPGGGRSGSRKAGRRTHQSWRSSMPKRPRASAIPWRKSVTWSRTPGHSTWSTR